MRLLGSGVNTLPILSIGDDEAGKDIQATLTKAAGEAGIDDSIQDYIMSAENKRFLVPNMKTSSTVIIIVMILTSFRYFFETRATFLADLPPVGNVCSINEHKRRSNSFAHVHILRISTFPNSGHSKHQIPG